MDNMSSYYPPPLGFHNPPHHYPYYPSPPLPPQLMGSAPPTANQIPDRPFSSYAQGPPQASHDEVRTLFIAGFPGDLKHREVYNLFSEFPGYQSSHIRSCVKSSQAYAFAVFADQQSAITAMQALNGLVFDLEKESTLFVELAKSNSRPKRSRTDESWPGSSDKKLRGIPDSGLGSNIHMPGMSNTAYNMIGYPSTQSHGISDSGAVSNKDAMKLSNSGGPYVPQTSRPCPTLFVSNLGTACTEQELNQVFSRCPGFLKLKMQNKFGVPVAFVDFQDVACSTGALNHLQGTRLYSSSEAEGMRLEYAKTRMGLRKKPM